MVDAIISLVGVLVGGLITWITTYAMENLRKKDEKKKKELETLSVTIMHYNTLWGKIRNATYWDRDNPSPEIIRYYYGEFSEMRLSNRVNELLYLTKERREHINRIDKYICYWISDSETGNLVSLPKLAKELKADMDMLATYFS